MAQRTLVDEPQAEVWVGLEESPEAPVNPLILVAGLVLVVFAIWTLIWGTIGAV